MAGKRDDNDSDGVTRRVLSLVTEAMDLLDAHGTCPEAAAYLALAQQKLRHLIRS
jgi:hypothetical protein